MAQVFNVKAESKKAYALFDTCSLRSFFANTTAKRSLVKLWYENTLLFSCSRVSLWVMNVSLERFKNGNREHILRGI